MRLPDSESMMLCRQCDTEFSVDSGYSSCRSDLCWTCQANSVAIMKMANISYCQKKKVHFTVHYTENNKVANIHINFIDYEYGCVLALINGHVYIDN